MKIRFTVLLAGLLFALSAFELMASVFASVRWIHGAGVITDQYMERVHMPSPQSLSAHGRALRFLFVRFSDQKGVSHDIAITDPFSLQRVGDSVPILYNPDNPSHARLWTPYGVIEPTVFFAILGIGACLLSGFEPKRAGTLNGKRSGPHHVNASTESHEEEKA